LKQIVLENNLFGAHKVHYMEKNPGMGVSKLSAKVFFFKVNYSFNIQQYY